MLFHLSLARFQEGSNIIQGREKKANKLEQSGLTTEQLLAMQEEAFRDAAQRHG
jgi:hypothetical protein